MSVLQYEDFKPSGRTQMEWGFGGRRKVRDGALLMALFLGGIGAGQFVVSTWFIESVTSALVGLLIVAVGKSAAHIVYLGRPSRFYRLFLRPKTSWISRGLIFMVVFSLFGAAYLAPELGFGWLPWTADSTGGRLIWIIAAVAGTLVMIYDGFVLLSCKSISSWHTAVMPVMFLTYSLAGGVALTYLTVLATEGIVLEDSTLLTVDAVLLCSMLALVLLYVLNLAGSNTTAREALRRLTRSSVAIYFIGIALVVGLLAPLVLTYYHHTAAGDVAAGLVAGAAVLELLGDISVRHAILRTGVHTPMLTA